MNNLEWLEAIKKEDDEFDNGKRDRGSTEIEFRQVKALEIIAEELCLLNKNKKE